MRIEARPWTPQDLLDSMLHEGFCYPLDALTGTAKGGLTMRLINPERLIEDKGFFIEDDQGRFLCVVPAQDIRNAPGVDLNDTVCIVPGHTDQHNIAEMAFRNGEERFREKVIKQLSELRTMTHSQEVRDVLGIMSMWVGCME